MAIKRDTQEIRNLKSAIIQFTGRSLSVTEGKLGDSIKEAYQYYYGELPAAYTRGGSSYVDRTVWESVNGTLQDLLNVFTSGEDAVRFAPLNSFDADGARAGTAMVNKVLLRDNPGYITLHDAFKECLLSKISFVKRYWQHSVENEVRKIEHVTMDELKIVLAEYNDNDDVDDSMLDIQKNDDGTVTATISIPVNRSGVKVEFVGAEEVDFDQFSRNIQECSYFRHRAQKTRNELVDLGFKEEDIERARALSTDLVAEDIEMTRDRDMTGLDVGDPRDFEKYLVDEIYVRTNLKGRKTKLYQVFQVNNEIVSYEEVSEIPFEVCTPFPTPGNIVGESVFDITKDIQNVKTALVRGYIDNIMSANYGRFRAVKGQYDKRSLLDNRPGGVVEENAIGMVDLFPHHPLPAGVDSILEQIEQAKERRTGVTRIGMGLSPEVFKNDNSFATVDMMMSAAQNRMRMVARNIAQNFMTQLFLAIYRLLKENAPSGIPIEVNGSMMEVSPQTWPDRDKVIVAVAIGQNERRERANNLVQLSQFLTQNPLLSGTTFTAENANHLARELTLAMGFYDVNNFITPMSQVQPQGPTPEQQAEQQRIELESQRVQLELQKITNDMEVATGRMQAEQTEAQAKLKRAELDEAVAGDKMNIEQAESESRQSKMASDSFVAERGVELEEKKLELKRLELQLMEKELELKARQIEIEAQLEMAQQRPVALTMGTRKPTTTLPQ